uniref:Putative secreted protein n=1 Tax=Ixodes ricinus TaxID=34613 RepID=A0A6B0ULT8_IXORI
MIFLLTTVCLVNADPVNMDNPRFKSIRGQTGQAHAFCNLIMDNSHCEQFVGRTEVSILTRQHYRSFGRDQTTSNSFFLCDAQFSRERPGRRAVKRPVLHIYTIFTHCAKEPRRRLFV